MMEGYSGSLEKLANQTKQTRVVRYFANTDLRGQHDSLKKWAKKHGKLDLESLGAGEFVVFSNKKQNRLKIIAPGNILTYVKAPDNHIIDLNVVRLIPRFFNGKTFEYDKALAETLGKKLSS